MADAKDCERFDPLDPEEARPRGLLPADLEQNKIPDERLAPVESLREIPQRLAPAEDLLPEWRQKGGLDGPLSAEALDGSWYLRLVPEGGGAPLHGVLRIEAKPEFGLQVSADLYHAPSAPLRPPRKQAECFDGLWYPHLPAAPDGWGAAYAAYLRGTAAALVDRRDLRLAFVHYPWNAALHDFGRGQHEGWMALRCSRRLFCHQEGIGLPTPKLHGSAMLGGILHRVTACKTSPYQRGCYVVAEEMVGTRWPANATLGGKPKTFTGVFHEHGIDIRGHFAPVKWPKINPLACDCCFRAINRAPFGGVPPDTWRMRLLVGLTGETPQGRRVLGVMRDDEEPYRETAVGFYKENLPAALRVQANRLERKLEHGPLGGTPLAFLRTLLHEAGHVFSLQHRADLVDVPPGQTLMEPTSAVIANALPGQQRYPQNAKFCFSDHDVAVLLHAPDVQVAPGRMPYNWLPGFVQGGVLPWREVEAWRTRT
ncbi:MAG TPA: hypothetical protein VGN83_12635 [Falsiroseomonas sp.]|nr:hypothetical protein [Falsiroseomonas sp.]